MSGLDIVDTDAASTTPSACGGALITLAVDPDNMHTAADFAQDCVTGLNWSFDPTPPTPISSVGGNINVTSNPLPWIDAGGGAPGTQWQTIIPARGAKMGLLSGSPVAQNGSGFIYPLGAGTSTYIYTRALPSADCTAFVRFQANNNTDNEIAFQLRRLDGNNFVGLFYNAAIPAFVILQRIAGVQTILGTQSFDLTTLASAGTLFTITAAGANITIANPNAILVGTFVTGVLTAAPFGFFFNSTGADNMGFKNTLEVDP